MGNPNVENWSSQSEVEIRFNTYRSKRNEDRDELRYMYCCIYRAFKIERLNRRAQYYRGNFTNKLSGIQWKNRQIEKIRQRQ